VHVAAGNAEGGVVLADGVLVRPFQQAVHLAFGVVVQLDLADAELVDPAVAGVGGDLRDGLGGQLEVLVKVHELWHVIVLSCGGLMPWRLARGRPRPCQRAGQGVQQPAAGPEVGGAGRDVPARDEFQRGARG